MGTSRAILFLLPLFIFACKSAKHYDNPERIYSFDEFIMGWGGGFTGEYEEYLIRRDGIVLQKNFGDDKFYPFGRFYESSVSVIFGELDDLKPWDINWDKPSNLTQYVEVRKDASKNRIIWGGHDSDHPPGIQEFFVNTRRKIRDLK